LENKKIRPTAVSGRELQTNIFVSAIADRSRADQILVYQIFQKNKNPHIL